MHFLSVKVKIPFFIPQKTLLLLIIWQTTENKLSVLKHIPYQPK